MFFNKKEVSKEELMDVATFSLILSIAIKLGMTPKEVVEAMVSNNAEIKNFIIEMSKANLDTFKNKDNK